ncbi:MAG: preprotein translocase subunit Sec61beta [Candidatus Hermodarchaeia archaeon]|jgi:preprotein translocase subunit Sec61beta
MPKSKRKRQSEGPMPAAGAGLIRFFADSSEGIKLGPVTVLLIMIALVVIVFMADLGLFNLFFPPIG